MHAWSVSSTCPSRRPHLGAPAGPRQPARRRPARAAPCSCTAPDASGPSSDEQQTAAWEEVANTVLKSNPVAQASFRRVADAQRRVSEIMAAQAELARATQEAEAASPAENAVLEREQAARASVRAADAHVSAAEGAVAEAEQRLLEAQLAKQEFDRAAGKDADRVESGKAAGVAAAAGLLASVPYAVSLAGTAESALLSSAGIAASCALFGVVYRYARRSDVLDNHLKGGALAAFGLVRGIAVADSLQAAASQRGVSVLDFSAAAFETVIGPSALAAGESMLVFGFAAVALEVALQRGIVAEISNSRSA